MTHKNSAKKVTEGEKNMDKKVKLIKESSINAETEDGIIRLYQQLAPHGVNLLVDIPMIINEAFPAFEKTIGKSNFNKVKRAFGIGVKKAKTVNKAEIDMLVNKLRTIENAKFYIHGYDELIRAIAKKMHGAPEYMTDLVKAKMLRMYFYIFVHDRFLSDDLVLDSEGKPGLDRIAIMRNTPITITPELLFMLWDSDLYFFKDNSIMYNMIKFELNSINKRLRKEVLIFAELEKNVKNGEEEYTSVNRTLSHCTYGDLRNLKSEIFPQITSIDVYQLSSIDFYKQIGFDRIYKIYKGCISMPYEERKSKVVNRDYWDRYSTPQLVSKPCEFKVLSDYDFEIYIASEFEITRILYAIKQLINDDFEVTAFEKDKETGEYKSSNILFASIWGALMFAKDQGFTTKDTPVNEEYKIVEELTMIDDDKGFSHDMDFAEFAREKISSEELKEKLGIDENFIKKILGDPAAEAADAVRKFAAECGIENISTELVENVIVPENEDPLKKYFVGDVGISDLKKNIGFNEKFSSMYFDLSKVDVDEIEETLLSWKKERNNKMLENNSLLIKLYCYVVQNKVKCGSKNKAPKGNKNLKPKNLLAMI